MKVAVITLYCNEEFRLSQWVQLYQEYKDEVYLHIIINNGCPDNSKILKNSFPNSHVIESPSKNMTKAYNCGLLEAFKHCEIEAIMQITNDVRFPKGTISRLYHKLMDDDSLAAIGPVMLKNNSDVVESFGYRCKNFHDDEVPVNTNIPISELHSKFEYVSFIPGGAVMYKRSAIQQIGLQDEEIHMYCDERDLSIRFNKAGYKEGVLCSAVSTHQHIFKPGTTHRSTMATFLTMRNRVYISLKYEPSIYAFLLFFRKAIYFSASWLYHNIKNREIREYDVAALKGLLSGIFRDMRNEI